MCGGGINDVRGPVRDNEFEVIVQFMRHIIMVGRIAQWLAHFLPNPAGPGSIPGFSNVYSYIMFPSLLHFKTLRCNVLFVFNSPILFLLLRTELR